MNTQFSVAVHILTFMETQAGIPASSELIASSVNTNPSLIRKLLSRLAKAGLVTAQMGTRGGALLAKNAENITLLDVYKAIVVDEGKIIPMHSTPNPQCPVGRNIQATLETRISDAEGALQAELARSTIAEMAGEIIALEPTLRNFG
ncbi:Rrf2 family transcriptional regulator [Rhizobium sp. ICMP 5592]|uniref:Rrf2 family transcriptional regulator n=1 Tax=Rhizobium sp. ICMP 5592 TaxID=2292445 RepID=UPI001295BDFC|nr:Rrf2 family transcriptional regulator [Rhizobium sp. ICMP 5592]MQB46007.1 Rrf2 family transcriptional regulator [Rhizobium sp. ICMP 5592]